MLAKETAGFFVAILSEHVEFKQTKGFAVKEYALIPSGIFLWLSMPIEVASLGF